MALKARHELHRRRFSRNLGVGLALAGFAALMFVMSAVKIKSAGPIEGFDHVVRPGLAERGE